jgi:hypothetical protein
VRDVNVPANTVNVHGLVMMALRGNSVNGAGFAGLWLVEARPGAALASLAQQARGTR